jgi:predicted DNA binding CopG/RHH family protein
MTRTSVNGRTRLNLYFDERVLEALRRIAAARGTTYSELIRQACREYVLANGGRTVQEVQAITEMNKVPPK